MSPDELVKRAIMDGKLEEGTVVALRRLLETMRRVETQVLSGRKPRVAQATVAEAAAIVHDVLARWGDPRARYRTHANATDLPA
jgi:hypothetical protein